MADKTNDQDEPITGGVDEQIRGVADEDDDFDDADELEDDDDEEEGSTF